MDIATLKLTNETLIAIFTGLAAMGTVSAIFVALFGNPRKWPRLKVQKFEPHPPDLAVVYSERDGEPSAWLRLRVANKSKANPAREVSVTLLDVVPLVPPTKKLEKLRQEHWPPLVEHHERLLRGYTLKWAERPVDRIDLPGGAEYLFDIAHLAGPPGEQHLKMSIFQHEQYGVYYRRRARKPRRWFPERVEESRGRPDYRHYLYSPAYALGFVLLSHNTRPTFYTVTLLWDGEWSADDFEISQHVKLMNLVQHRHWPPRNWPPPEDGIGGVIGD